MSENQSETKFMTALCEATFLIRQLAGPDTGKRAILRVSRKLGAWTYNRVKDVYYADKRIKISGAEIDSLRALSRTIKSEERVSDPSIAELRDQLAVVVRHLQRIDPTFHDPSIEALGCAAHSNGEQEDNSSHTDGEIRNA